MTQIDFGASPVETTFRDRLFAPDQPVPEGLLDGLGRPAGRRYAVYRNNIAVSLREALEAGFPAIRTLLGEENFATLAGHYLRQHPPTTPMMMFYGADFPEYIEATPQLAHLGYLGDVARLELLQRESYHAADARPFDPNRLQNLGEEALNALRLAAAPATRLLQSKWPVLSIYRYTMQTDAPKPAARAETVLITRPELDPVLSLVPDTGVPFVAALLNGAPFGAAIEAAPNFDLSENLSLLLGQAALRDPE